MTISKNSSTVAPSQASLKEPTGPSSGDAASVSRGTEELAEAEQALWRDPERLARIEAVLDDPSLAVPLDELD